jgi:outer membrane protein, multidrug efflux system
MTNPRTNTSPVKLRALFIACLLLAALPLRAEPIEFRQAIEMALKHSGVMIAATADRARAAQRYRAERYAYFPTVVFGVSPGYSVGIPLTVAGQVPSLYNVTHTQTLFNLAAQESIKAAHSDSVAASIDYVDRGEQVILDTALLYIELDNTAQRLDAARQQKEAVAQAFYIAQQRQQEGVGSLLDTKRAELDAARVDLRIAELETNLDVLRERLGRVIGRSPASLETVTTSIPAAPPLPQADTLTSVALANSATVRVADEHVRAAHDRARAEHRVNYPSIDFAGQYAELTPYINYGLVNPSTRNYSFAFNVRIPLLNLSQNAHAAAADADAMHAEADAQAARDQVAADAVRAQHTIHQLEVSARVSRLEFEVAQANIDAVKLQVEQGHANARDEEMAVADVANRQVNLLEMQFEFERAELQLLRQTGELHGWALGSK